MNEDKKRFRTGWISDVHLGTRGCNAQGLYHFLDTYEFEQLYIVGDFVDFWRLRRSRYWPQSHTNVMQKLLKRSKKGTELIFIPGNHDEMLLNFLGHYGNIQIVQNIIHETADGRRLLVMHGHELDVVTMHAKWISHLGEMGYNLLILLNGYFNAIRRKLGMPYWSFSAFIKHKVKDAVSFISNYENALIKYAEKYNVDGVICGHIHNPAIRQMERFWYYNTGDWVESSTALIEDESGQISLVHMDVMPNRTPLEQEKTEDTVEALAAIKMSA
ncbi:MAG: UDP-2,3-diacylglucosamine hydrolase [Phycisphaerae bacterium]|nr:UDP-2,3-diacylglucosamine hydrolase [Phycisphaerae bacterium]